ncbi:restriction endonuclease subunit S [Sedimentimonas flavescens]|uniref:restriction endonuclease subunit S n=1 Tax=Sedimentimonas flavescens TaxID=2851012 RepID=UPI001C4A21FE|nr:restriction endonuclease subunit S [Sedimentimonas flavescens]MBW0157629.1 restriction endonuclease subunit S [Sedimentimonas flavescens]
MNGWRNEALGSGSTQILDGDRGKNYPSKQQLLPAGDCLFLSATNVTKRGFDFSKCEFISADRDSLLRKGKLARFDSVLTTRGTVGNVAYFGPTVPFEHVRINSGMVIIRPDKAQISSEFLSFFLRSELFSDQIASLTSGSAQPQLPIRDLRHVQLPVPPIEEQREIAAILGTLDDKIELNRKTAATLEAMARALYRSWFVDFDPVWAKTEGRPPAHMAPATAALFPDSFGDDGLPVGWRMARIDELCSRIFSGGTPKTSEGAFWGGEFPWLSSGETRQSLIVDTEKTITDAGIKGSSTRRARRGAIVVASAGQGKTRGQTSYLSIDCYVNQSVIACEADTSVVPDSYLYCDLQRRYEEFRAISDANSSRGSLTTKMVGGLEVVLPTHEIVEAFDIIVAPMIARLINNARENKTLATLRDTLLPRLMSGELRVGEARELAEEVA